MVLVNWQNAYPVQMVSPLGGDSLTGYGTIGSQPGSPVWNMLLVYELILSVVYLKYCMLEILEICSFLQETVARN